jgi:integrase
MPSCFLHELKVVYAGKTPSDEERQHIIQPTIGAISSFDHAIARACRKAAKLANLEYGRTNAFTCHSLRHTFVTDMMEATGKPRARAM